MSKIITWIPVKKANWEWITSGMNINDFDKQKRQERVGNRFYTELH